MIRFNPINSDSEDYQRVVAAEMKAGQILQGKNRFRADRVGTSGPFYLSLYSDRSVLVNIIFTDEDVAVIP